MADVPHREPGFLRAFGSRNHPETKARKATAQKARAGMAVTDETVATYTAARGFLMGEWLGASIMVASFALIYLLASPKYGVSGGVAIAVCLALFALGGYVFWTNHRYYVRLDFPWASRWDVTAQVVAGSGAIFWLLFALLEVLTLLGVHVLPG